MAETAPYYAEVAGGPEDVRVCWAEAKDGTRLRAAYWPGGAEGTVLLFTGRTEYLEKYGLLAGEFVGRGLSTISIDWRGQGLSDRALDDPDIGHVVEFADYQLDVDTLLATARRAGAPEPFVLLAHSMGGCIGLRSLHEGLPVAGAVFTAPMWGIRMAPVMRPVAWVLSALARRVGQGHRYVPTTGPVTYMADAPFEDNVLTTDREMFELMRRQVTEHPDLSIGGPSLHWLFEALIETRHLMQRAAPVTTTVTFLGANERVVGQEAIRERMEDWRNGRLVMVPGAEHEVLMERSAIRAQVVGTVCDVLRAGPPDS